MCAFKAHIKSSIFENIFSGIEKIFNIFSISKKIFPKIINYCGKIHKTKGRKLPLSTSSNIFFFFPDSSFLKKKIFKMNYDKFTIRLNFLIISSMFANFQENQISKAMSSKKKKNLNSYFCSFKLCIKNKFMDQIVNNIKFKRNLTCILKI